MQSGLDFSQLLTNAETWFSDYVWTANTLFEFSSILFAFAAGAVIGRVLEIRATKAIEASNLPLRTKRMAKNARRVLAPISSLVVLFLVTQAASADVFAMDVSLSVAVMKALLAWIAIRLALQFIENGVIRSVATWTIWGIAAFSIFGILDETSKTLDDIGFTIGTFHVSALEIFKSALLLLILLYLALFVSTFFERKVLKSKTLSRSSQVLVVKVIRMILIVIAVIIGVTSAGIDLSIFAVFSGAVGLGIGFGLQKVASNLFSGLLLLMDQSIKPGDVIEIEPGVYGWINQMAARYTEVVTRDNKSYLIPNEDFIAQRIVNWSHTDSLVRIEVPFGVHYDSDPHEVRRVALEVVRKPSRVAADPTPDCYLRQFGESSIDFSLHFWIKDAEHGIGNIKSEVLLGLWDAFKANGIQIPFPTREVYMREVKQESKKARG